MAKGRSTKHRGSMTGKYMSAEATGRYTKPIPKDHRKSPVWYTVMVIALLVLGTVLLVGNYLSFLPGAVSPWYLGVGLLLILVGFLAATKLK